MSWQPELDELRERERMARELGGADKVKRQHDAGKLTIRERIDGLVDDASFHEIGAIAGKAVYDGNNELKELVPSNCVFGRAQIDGRPVVVVGDDFTVRGGSADATIREKPLMAEQMAHDLRLPIIRIIEGSGGGGSVKTIETTGRANLPGRVNSALPYYFTTTNLGLVPVVALGLGSVAGLGSARIASSHYSVMTKETSAMFVAGPPVVNALGNSNSTGSSSAAGRSRRAAARSTTRSTPRRRRSRRRGGFSPTCRHRCSRCCPRAADRRPRAARRVPVRRDPAQHAASLQDAPDRRGGGRQGLLLRDGPHVRPRHITGLARIDGLPVAVMASTRSSTAARGPPTSATRSSALSIWPRPSTCRSSICAIAPGFQIGLEAEKSATIRKGVRAMAAVNQTSVPWCTFPGAQRVRRRRRGQPAGRAVLDPLRLAVGALGFAAAGGRDRGRLPRRDRRRARPRRQDGRDRGAAANCARHSAPPRPFWVEEIIDPRDTRRSRSSSRASR